MPEKPPLPAGLFDPFLRVEVDDSEGSAFREIVQIGLAAADDWTLGPDGPYKRPNMTPAGVTRTQVSEALLHLLELGFIDIDEERLRAAPGWPMQRERRDEEAA